MSSLDNLVTKIIKDSHDKGSAIIKDAEAEAKKLVEGRVAEANRVKDAALEDGRREAEMQKAMIVSAKRIEVRDEMLKTKQELIARVFDKAVEELNHLDNEQYLGFMKKYLLQLDIDGDEEIFVPERYAGISLATVNESLTAAGKPGGLTLGSGSGHVKSGFMIAKNGVENNNTYEALLDYYRDELEKTVAEQLF